MCNDNPHFYPIIANGKQNYCKEVCTFRKSKRSGAIYLIQSFSYYCIFNGQIINVKIDGCKNYDDDLCTTFVSIFKYQS